MVNVNQIGVMVWEGWNVRYFDNPDNVAILSAGSFRISSSSY